MYGEAVQFQTLISIPYEEESMAEIYKRETPGTEEKFVAQNRGPVEHRERVRIDTAAEWRQTAVIISQIVWFVFGLIEGLIAIRVILKLMAANPANPFAYFIYQVTNVFLWPFFGLTVTPRYGNVILEISSIIAIIVYALLAWVIVRLVWLLFYRPADDTTVVESYDRDRR